MTENRSYMQRYAMLLGTYMGIYWIVKFIFIPLGMTMPFLMLLFMGLTLGVPVMGYYFAKLYRDKVLGGSISWGHAWMFTTFMYMFASLLTAAAHYLYFRFIDGGYILRSCETQLDQLAISGIPGIETYIATYRQSLELAAQLTPLDIALQMMSSNFFFGMLLAVPTALFVMRRKGGQS